MNRAIKSIKLKCIFANQEIHLFEGLTYTATSSDWPYPDTIHMYVRAKANSNQRGMLSYDVWKAPSGLYYILKRHCQPWDGVHAVFEEVK